MVSFSVLIPAYNAAPTIRHAILSALNQSYPPKEIIVIDDGSTDDISSVVLEFSSKVKLYPLKINQGVSAARNKAWDLATGDYIAFLDSDDEWHVDKLKIISGYLKRDNSLNLITHSRTVQFFADIIFQNQQIKKITFFELLVKNDFQTSCIIIKRGLDFRFDEKMRYCEDHDLLLRMNYRLDGYFLDLPLTKLNRPQLSEGGLSGDKWRMRKGEINAYFKLKELNPLFIFLFPFLFTWSLLKYLKVLLNLRVEK